MHPPTHPHTRPALTYVCRAQTATTTRTDSAPNFKCKFTSAAAAQAVATTIARTATAAQCPEVRHAAAHGVSIRPEGLKS
jgi:hypothetical protein